MAVAVDLGSEFESLSVIEPTRTNREIIEVTWDQQLVIELTIAALGAHATNVYQRGGIPVRVRSIESPDVVAFRDRERDVIDEVQNASALIPEIASAAEYWRYDAKGVPTRIAPPAYLPQAVLNSSEWRCIPALEALVDTPVLAPDGALIDRAGFDRRTGILLRPSRIFHHVLSNPTREEAVDALETLKEPFREFEFGSEMHHTAVLASVLTIFARLMIDGPVPLFMIDKSTPGTGGTLLADTVGIIATGRGIGAMTNENDDAELRKKITSLALAGARVVCIDNVDGFLGAPSLDAALTQTQWEDRILGRSEHVHLPLHIVWFATGNNIRLRNDTRRRVVHIRMDTTKARPEKREFEIERLERHVHQNRERYVQAALTILRAYIHAGMPRQKVERWGKFEEWARLVVECLVWLGMPDIGPAREELERDADTESALIEELIEAWFGWAGHEFRSVQHLVNEFQEDDGRAKKNEPRRLVKLRGVIDELCGSRPDQLPRPRQVGNALRKFRNRVSRKEMQLIRSDERGEFGYEWAVVRVGERPPTGPQPYSNFVPEPELPLREREVGEDDF